MIRARRVRKRGYSLLSLGILVSPRYFLTVFSSIPVFNVANFSDSPCDNSFFNWRT